MTFYCIINSTTYFNLRNYTISWLISILFITLVKSFIISCNITTSIENANFLIFITNYSIIYASSIKWSISILLCINNIDYSLCTWINSCRIVINNWTFSRTSLMSIRLKYSIIICLIIIWIIISFSNISLSKIIYFTHNWIHWCSSMFKSKFVILISKIA